MGCRRVVGMHRDVPLITPPGKDAQRCGAPVLVIGNSDFGFSTEVDDMDREFVSGKSRARDRVDSASVG
jgi:hypothetical protein